MAPPGRVRQPGLPRDPGGVRPSWGGAGRRSRPGRATSAVLRAAFPDRDAQLGLFAPGVDITSAWNSGDTAERTLSGTSMAAPHAAGAAALHLSSHRRADPKEVRNALAAAAATHRNKAAGTGSPTTLSQVSSRWCTPDGPPPYRVRAGRGPCAGGVRTTGRPGRSPGHIPFRGYVPVVRGRPDCPPPRHGKACAVPLLRPGAPHGFRATPIRQPSESGQESPCPQPAHPSQKR
ncbi:S8 family serine peptidase [Streptomyces sp. NPDC018045]|uniref:S8 family serine peptidase n=1 Tax=Streptomyces sp. NPDC018045 TaxID=3365037 RepID=UPI003790B327